LAANCASKKSPWFVPMINIHGKIQGPQLRGNCPHFFMTNWIIQGDCGEGTGPANEMAKINTCRWE
jgi:hypothetical protein